MFIYFESSTRFAVKIYAGNVNIISGKKSYGRKYMISPEGSEQDYIVAPEQAWVDGIAEGLGQVKQFVATRSGQGFVSQTPRNLVILPNRMYSVEAHVTGSEI